MKLDAYPACSIGDGLALHGAICDFLRTHRNGWSLLEEYMRSDSVPPDRTAEEYEAEQAQARKEWDINQRAFLEQLSSERLIELLLEARAAKDDEGV